MTASRNVIITCAVTGSIHTPSMSPHLPITPKEIADAAVAAAEAGAAIVHLHARDPVDGHPTQDPKYFREFAADIARRSDVVINFTTGGAATMSIEERLQPALQLKPEVASLNMGSMNFGLFPMLKRFKTFRFDWERPDSRLRGPNLQELVRGYRVHPHIVRRQRHAVRDRMLRHRPLVYSRALLERDLVKPPLFIQSVFGILGGIPDDVAHIAPPTGCSATSTGERAGRGTEPAADRDDVRADGRQCPRRTRRQPVDRPRQAGRIERCAGPRRAGDHRRHGACGRFPTRRGDPRTQGPSAGCFLGRSIGARAHCRSPNCRPHCVHVADACHLSGHLGMATASDIAGAASSGCRLVKVEDWPIRMQRNRLLVDGAINGQKVSVMLDTGAERTLILRAAAVRLGLPLSGTTNDRMFGVGGETKVDVAFVDEFRVGQAAQKQLRLLVAGEHDLGDDVGVLLGEDFFQRFDVEFDLAHNAVRLFQPKDCDVRLAYWRAPVPASGVRGNRRNRPEIILAVGTNGQTMKAKLDSVRTIVATRPMRSALESRRKRPASSWWAIASDWAKTVES